MTLFLKLLLAHIIGDFCFQPNSWVADKRKYKYKSKKLYLHTFIHAALVATAFGFNTRYWMGFLFIIVSHYLIDLVKLYAENRKNALLYFSLDQALHLIILAIVTHHYQPFDYSFTGILSTPHLLFITALALVIFVPAVLIKMMIAQWRLETKDRQGSSLFQEEDSLIRAGRFIGILERLFVFIFIITDHWEAVGFLLAAKSIFRFGDLREGKDRKLTEYVLIGTLLSFGIAILIGLGYLYLAAT
ncbi:DUF3307 domain-containing protein [Parapedobacter tibetensis]|uniref:DUF3307 domain-containing protein n=1 Tax=Parapedobacter tibetensis TaxID=2972951 RepID=UPI00214DB3EC|nr:DUF3307 domain-containing protein [Parapedobacter tibetensis]